jgi:hypothetical protein
MTHGLHGIGAWNVRECLVALRPRANGQTAAVALTRPAPSRCSALADAVGVRRRDAGAAA